MQGHDRLPVGGDKVLHVDGIQLFITLHVLCHFRQLPVQIVGQAQGRDGGQMVLGQILAQKNVVAVVALHDAADLAGLEGEGGVLELLDKIGALIDEIALALTAALVLAVFIGKLGEERLQLRRVRFLELGKELFGLGLLLRGLLLAQGLVGFLVLGHQQDVVYIGVVLAGGLVEIASRVLGQRQQMLVVVAGGGHPVKVLLGDAHFPQVVHKVLLASQLVGVGGPVLLDGGLVLIGEGDLVCLRHILHYQVGQGAALGLLPGDLGQGCALQLAVPLQGAVLVDDLAVLAAAVHVHHADLGLHIAAGGGQPVEVQPHGDGPAVGLQGRLVRVHAQEVVVNIPLPGRGGGIGGAVLIVSAGRVVLAAAARAQA